jgi:hypothetical protein
VGRFWARLCSGFSRVGFQPSAQLVAQQNVDKPVDTSLQAIQVKAFSSVRNFLRTTAQEVAHFSVT